MFFGLWTMWAYVTWVRCRGAREYLIMALLYAMCLISKSTLVTMPCALLLLDYWPLRRGSGGLEIVDSQLSLDGEPGASVDAANPTSTIHNPQSILGLILEKTPLFALSIAQSVVTFLVQRGSHQLEEGDWVPLRLAAANAVVSYARYLGKLFWPVDLAALYPHPSLVNGETWPGWAIVGSIALLLVITVLAAVLCRKRPYLIVGWLWFLGTMVPVIGFVQIGRQAMADRYAYVPFNGLYMAIVWSAADALNRQRWGRQFLVILLATAITALSAVTIGQIAFWNDSLGLFQHAIESTSRNWLMHNNVAGMLGQTALDDERQGHADLAAARRREAETHLKQALGIQPNAAWLHKHHGELLAQMNRLAEAQDAFERAVELDPASAEYHHKLAIILQQRQRPDAAIAELQKEIDLDPRYAPARVALALVLSSQKRWSEAEQQMLEAKRLNPAGAAEYDQVLAGIRAQRDRAGRSP